MRFEYQPKHISCLGKWLIDDNYQCFVKYQGDLQAPSTSCSSGWWLRRWDNGDWRRTKEVEKPHTEVSSVQLCVEISYQKHVYAAWKSRWVEHKNSAVLEIDSIALDCFFFCSCLKSCVCFLNHSLHDPPRTSYFQMPILTIQTCSGLFPTLSIWLCGVTRKDWKSRNSIMNHPVISTKFNCRSVDKRHSGRNTI